MVEHDDLAALMAGADLVSAVLVARRKLRRDQPWRRRALCSRHPEIDFFLDKHQSSAPARALCARCPVQQDCLAYALSDDSLAGIWGGTSHGERRKMRREAA